MIVVMVMVLVMVVVIIAVTTVNSGLLSRGCRGTVLQEGRLAQQAWKLLSGAGHCQSLQGH